MMPLMQVSGLEKSFGGVKAVDGLDFDLHPGELLAMIGPNGSGKSTTFNLINGQLSADRGSIRLDEVELLGASRVTSGGWGLVAPFRSPKPLPP